MRRRRGREFGTGEGACKCQEGGEGEYGEVHFEGWVRE